MNSYHTEMLLQVNGNVIDGENTAARPHFDDASEYSRKTSLTAHTVSFFDMRQRRNCIKGTTISE